MKFVRRPKLARGPYFSHYWLIRMSSACLQQYHINKFNQNQFVCQKKYFIQGNTKICVIIWPPIVSCGCKHINCIRYNRLLKSLLDFNTITFFHKLLVGIPKSTKFCNISLRRRSFGECAESCDECLSKRPERWQNTQ